MRVRPSTLLDRCRCLAGLALVFAASHAGAQPAEIQVYAGEPLAAPALSIPLMIAQGIAVDSAGHVFVTTGLLLKIYRIDPSGQATLYAGSGIADNAVVGDGVLATEASIGYVTALEVDAAGNLYWVDFEFGRVRKVDKVTGTVSTVATGPTFAWVGLAIDAGGNVFVAEPNAGDVLRVDATTHTVAQIAQNLGTPGALAVNAAGDVLVSSGNQVLKVAAGSGSVSVFAGGGTGGDGGPAATAVLSSPEGIHFDAAGNLFIAETGGNRVRRVDATTGLITTVAGNGLDGFSGDGGDARLAQVGAPYGVAVDAAGNLLVTTGSRVRRVDHATGVISTVGGNGEWRFGGDGLPASEATFYYPAAAAAVAGGGFVIADRDNQRVRRIDGGTGLVSTIAGPTAPLCESVASFFYGSLCPVAVAADGAGNVFAADAAAYHIRKIAAGTGLVTTIAGNGSPGASGDGGPATAASIGQPFGLAVDGGGNLFFADFAFHCVRRIDHATGVITTVVGTGQPGYAGDGGPARAATLASPAGVAFDGRGNLYIADHDNNRVRRVDPAGVITTVAGNGTQGATGDGGPATAAALSLPISVAADASGNLAIADQGNNKVRRVDAGNGVITTLAGTGDVGLYGMGGPATSAVISAPRGVLLDAAGELFVVDQLHHRLLRVRPETTPRAFFTVPPCRIADTREPAGAQGGPSLTPSADRVFGVGGRCQVPSSAKAVSLNVTVTGPGGSGDLRLYPGGGFVPQASAINYAAGQTRANSAVLALGLSGNVAVKVDQGVGAVDVILDVNGYFE